MAKITLTIPDDKIQEVLDAYDFVYRQRTSQTKAQWAKSIIISGIKSTVHEYRRRLAEQQVDTSSIDIT